MKLLARGKNGLYTIVLKDTRGKNCYNSTTGQNGDWS